MRFLFTSSFFPPYHIGGDAVHVSYLADELAKRGNEVHVLHSLDAYRIKKGKAELRAKSNDIHIHSVETPFRVGALASYLLGSFPSVNRRFYDLIKEVKPHVVHHHNISLLGYDILKKRGHYLNLYTAHDYWLFCQQNNLMKFGRSVCKKKNCTACSFAIWRPRQIWRNLPAFRQALKEVDCVIAPSNFMLKTLEREFPFLGMRHIPNFAPRTKMDFGADTDTEAPYFVYVGVLENHKGIIPFLNRFARWASNRNVGITIIGTGSLEHQISKLAHETKMNEKIKMLGRLPLSSVLRHFFGAIALVMPSTSPENAPLVALEALSVGSPVLSSDVGGLPEITGRVDSRLLFSWNDPAGLEATLDFAFENRLALRASAKKAYDIYFSDEKYVNAYEELIHNSLESFAVTH